MGLDAQVIAIGEFSEKVLPALEYPEDFYTDVLPGQTVIVNVFIGSTSTESHQLAQAFGVDAMELGKHHLNPENADLEVLQSIFGKDDVHQFLVLKENGFNFYYLPNA